MLRETSVISLALTLALAACGAGSDTGPSSGADARSSTLAACNDEAKPASDKVLAVIDANRSCTSDADCTTIAFATDCFDSCTRGIAKSGQAAVERAESDASANECKAFAAAGCKRIVPPCAPPLPPACRAGRCE